MTTRFERDTSVEVVRDGVFSGIVDPGWRIVHGANGGHLAAILLRAMTATVDDPARHPRVLNVHFARRPKEEPIEIVTTLERSGRTMSNVSARMQQDGKLIVLGIAAFSTQRSGPDFSDIAMPDVPAPDDGDPVPDREDFPFGRQFDFRRVIGPASDARSDRAEIGVWMRLREPQPADVVVVTQLCDAFAPAVFAKLGVGGGGAGVPTVEMTYTYREQLPLADARPDDWYLAVFRTTTSRGGFIEEDGWLWHGSGILVAQSRQSALLSGS